MAVPESGGLWIFGYGSLLWRPAFTHSFRVPGSIKGWKRRFWQGSTDHRGVPGKPGRVVTLLPFDVAFDSDDHCDKTDRDSSNYTVWGMCYWIEQKEVENVLKYLDYREKGGYTRTTVEVTIHHSHPEYQSHTSQFQELPNIITALLYTANETNEEYLGPAPLSSIAAQIATSVGPSGPNTEYLFELGKSLKKLNVKDSHVEDLVREVSVLVVENNSSIPK